MFSFAFAALRPASVAAAVILAGDSGFIRPVPTSHGHGSSRELCRSLKLSSCHKEKSQCDFLILTQWPLFLKGGAVSFTTFLTKIRFRTVKTANQGCIQADTAAKERAFFSFLVAKRRLFLRLRTSLPAKYRF